MTYSAASDTLLSDDQILGVVARALDAAPLEDKRVLLIIPDGTRSGPIGLLFRSLCEVLRGRAAALDVLIALGTHQPLNQEQILRRLDVAAEDWAELARWVRVFNHEWWKPETFYTAGTISADEIHSLSHGLLAQPVDVQLNRRVCEYDQLIICGPVFPHEVAGYSGGSKYLFPGVAGAEIINLTHWLGALLTSYAIIGTRDTPVRAVIERAAEFVTTPRLDLCLVVRSAGLVGIYAGEPREAWRAAADHSAREHVIYLERPVQRAISIMPPLYDDLWTAAKGMYKVEPVIADGGEVVIYAPRLSEVSFTHGKVIKEIGYHVRDYFLKQWDAFKHYPWGVLAHSTHLRGSGAYDPNTRIESPRIRVTLATGIPREVCEQLNLSYADPDSIDPQAPAAPDTLVVQKAGERLYRLRMNTELAQ